MSSIIPEAYLDLFQKRSFAHLATVMADGTPQVTPIWIDFDGQHLLVNSAKGRTKDRNMENRPVVALEIMDPDDPYRYLLVWGRVVEIIEEGAADHIDKFELKYRGKPKYALPAGQVRRIYKIAPEKAEGHG
jgi:PPOX class probable F420-dependent enzyme